jgi:tetratricopeptide (TPR) repeat protein
MSEKLRNLFEESSCPDRETLFSYMTGKLSPAREHLVEAHLVDCAFCSEAIEAYREEKDLPMINEQLIEMEERISRGDTGRRSGGFFNPQHYLKYAALLAVILLSMTGLYLLLSDNKDQNIVMEAPVSRQAPTVQKSDDNRRQAPEPAKAVKMSGKKNAAGNLNSMSEALDESEDGDAFISSESETEESYNDLSAGTLAKESKEGSSSAQKDVSKTTASSSPKKSNRVEEDNLKVAPSSPPTTKTEDFDDVAFEVRTNDTGVALETTVANNRGSGSVLDNAIKEYEKNFYINTINLLITFSSTDKREQAKAEWYLASAYAQIKDYEKARPILEKLGSGNSSYARKARKLLATF